MTMLTPFRELTFKKYIEITGIIPLYVDYTKDSTRSLEDIRKIVIKRCNRVADKYDIDVKCYVTDHHNGNKYLAYSDKMVKKYDVLKSNWVLDYDAVAISSVLQKMKIIGVVLRNSIDFFSSVPLRKRGTIERAIAKAQRDKQLEDINELIERNIL